MYKKPRGMLLLTKAKRPWKFKMLCGFNKHAVKLHKAAPYAFPIPLNTFWSYKSKCKGDIRQTPKQLFYDPSLTHKGGSGGKTDRLFRLSTYAFPIPLDIFWRCNSNNKGDIRQKLKISYFMTPSLTHKGGPGVKLRLSTYGFLLPPSTFYGSKCNT